MMKEDELLRLIAEGEGVSLEFKRDDLRPEQLARELVALANADGGVILIGVEDDGAVSGIKRKNLCEWLCDTVLGAYVHPFVTPHYTEVRCAGGVRVAVVQISNETEHPYVLRNNGREDVYVRIGNVTRLASREQQARLYARGGLLQTELMPLPATNLDSLDRARLENYLRDFLKDPIIPQTEKEWQERLLDLGFMVQVGESNSRVCCSIAGVVLFGIRPRRIFGQAGLRLMFFGSLDKEYQALMDVVLDAPLVGRWLVKEGGRTLIDAGLIEKCTDAIEPFVVVEDAQINTGFSRGKTRLYPYEAVREVVINALAHRDWTASAEVEVCGYGDRLEVLSPGSFANSMNVQKMFAGLRVTRNQLIVEVLKDYGYVDSRGMGIRTKVVPLMKAFGLMPQVQATEDFVRVRLPQVSSPERLNYMEVREDSGSLVYGQAHASLSASYAPIRPVEESSCVGNASLSSLQMHILELIAADPKVTYDEMLDCLAKNRSTIMRNIARLKTLGLLERVGSKKTGFWRILT